MSHRLVAQNTLYQLLGRCITSGITFLITIFIANVYGAQGYGNFAKITTYIGFFYLFTDFGLNAIYLQQDKSKFKSLLTFRLLVSVGLLCIASLLAFFLPYDAGLDVGFSPDLRPGIILFSLTILFYAVMLSATAIFQKQQHFLSQFYANSIGYIVTLGIVLLAVFFKLPLVTILFAFVVGEFLGAALALLWTKEQVFPLAIDKPYVRTLLSQSWPLGLMLIFNLVYFRLDIFLLSLFQSTTDVGIYGFAYKFFDFFLAIPLFLSNALYPLLLAKQHERHTYTQLLRRYFLVFIAASFLLMIPAWFLSPLFAAIKTDFLPSVIPFRLLLLSLPLFFATSFLQWVLIVQKQQKFLLVTYAFSMVVIIVLNLLFLPRGSYVAAAIITGIGEAIVFVCLLTKLLLLQKEKK